MKKIFLLSSVLLSLFGISQQINVVSEPVASLNKENAFLDASSLNADMGYANSESKGLVFPQTDLTQFIFKTDNVAPGIFPTYFDGMIVYNTGEGTVNATGTEANTKGQKVDVKRGFYYFSNPDGEANGSVAQGKWVRIGDGASNKVISFSGTTPVDTGVTIESKSVMAVKGTFTHDGGNSVIIPKPTEFGTMYQIKIYRKGGAGTAKDLVGTTLYSYENEGTNQLKLNFGQGGILSLSYPQGDYEYVLEYIKS